MSTPIPGAGQTEILRTLLTAATNASFDCGAHDSDDDSNPDDPPYEELARIAAEKRIAVVEFFRATLAAAGAPTETPKLDVLGDRWHSLTCDGTCSPPCKDAPQQYVWPGDPPAPLLHLTKHNGPFYACADVDAILAAGAPVQQSEPVAVPGTVEAAHEWNRSMLGVKALLSCTEGELECIGEPLLDQYIAEVNAVYSAMSSYAPAAAVARPDLASLERFKVSTGCGPFGDEIHIGPDADGQFVNFVDVEALFAPDQTTGEKK